MNPSKIVSAARVSAEAVLGVAVSLSAFVFVLGMPFLGLDHGFWKSQEVPAAAMLLLSAAAAFALGVLVAIRDHRATGAVSSWPVLALLALSAASFTLAPLAEDPWKSVYGALQHGVGGLWHLEVAVLVAAAMVLLRSRLSGLMVASAFVATVAVLFLYAFPGVLGIGRPMAFHEWSGMLAGAVAFAVILTSRSLLGWTTAAAVALLIAGVVVSGNRTVIIAATAVVAAVVLGMIPALRRLTRSVWFRAVVPVVIAVVGMASMWAFAPVYEAMKLRDVPVSAAVGTDRPEDQINLIHGSLGTLWSRSYMVRIIIDEVSSDPVRLLTGNGWGSFSTTYEKHARSAPGRMYPMQGPLASRTYWDSHSKANFHSHNMAAEALNSLGIPGLALWLAFLGALGASSRRGLLAATAIATISTFWFPLAQMTMATALLIAAGAGPGRYSLKVREAMAGVSSAPTTLTVTVLGMAGLLSINLATLETAERELAAIEVDRNPATCRTIQASFLPEKESNIYLYRVLVGRIMSSDNPQEAVFDHATNVANMSCTMRAQSLNSLHIPSLVESLEARAKIAALGPVAYGLIAEDLIAWSQDLDRLLEAAPGRTDLLVPYFEILRARNHITLLHEAERYAVRVPENDPIHAYLLATVSEMKGDMGASKEHMRRAVKLGYASLVRLTDSYAAELSDGL